MMERLETFKRLKEQMVLLGLVPFKNLPNWCHRVPVDKIYTSFLSITLILFVLTTSCFLIFEEKTFEELSESVFYTVQSILYCTMYPLLQFTAQPLLKTIDELEGMIEKRNHLKQMKFWGIIEFDCIIFVYFRIEKSIGSEHLYFDRGSLRTFFKQIFMVWKSSIFANNYRAGPCWITGDIFFNPWRRIISIDICGVVSLSNFFRHWAWSNFTCEKLQKLFFL